jgi:hypothetical protein
LLTYRADDFYTLKKDRESFFIRSRRVVVKRQASICLRRAAAKTHSTDGR